MHEDSDVFKSWLFFYALFWFFDSSHSNDALIHLVLIWTSLTTGRTEPLLILLLATVDLCSDSRANGLQTQRDDWLLSVLAW